MRPAAAQCRFVPPWVDGGEPRNVNGLFHIWLPSPVATSAVQMDHACGRCSRIGSGAPPFPGRRTKAIRFPSGDRSEEHTSELQSQSNLVCRLLLEKKKKKKN